MKRDLRLVQATMSSAVNTKTNQFYVASPAKMLKYQHIAPAPVQQGCAAVGKTPRKYTPRVANAPYASGGGGGGGVGDQTQSVQRRNARERNRVKQVNTSFAKLRQHIPQTIIADLTKGGGRGPHKKVSKVDTLRIAVEYIRRLQDLVDDLNGGGSETASNSSYASSTLAASNGASAPLGYTTTASSGSAGGGSTTALPSFQRAVAAVAGQHQSHPPQYPSALLTPVSLNAYSPQRPNPRDGAGCHSPTSSFNSSVSSFDSGNFELPTSTRPHAQMSPALDKPSAAHLDAHLQLKFEPYESFHLHEEDCSPDDEELLDYISLWQEQ